MTTMSRPSGRLTAMIWRMRLRVALALGQSSTSTARLNASHGPWNSQTNSAIISQPDHLHQVDVHAGTGKAPEGREQHPVAAGEQQQDRQPHPRKEFLQGDPHQPQPLWRLERAERRPQTDIDREHAADPDDGPEYVQGEGDGGHERLSIRGMTVTCRHTQGLASGRSGADVALARVSA